MLLLANGWTKEPAGGQLAASLTDQAATVLMTIPSTQRSYDDIMAALQNTFSSGDASWTDQDDVGEQASPGRRNLANTSAGETAPGYAVVPKSGVDQIGINLSLL